MQWEHQGLRYVDPHTCWRMVESKMTKVAADDDEKPVMDEPHFLFATIELSPTKTDSSIGGGKGTLAEGESTEPK